MCIADDRLMAIRYGGHSGGHNEAMQCRDWDKLIEWATDPERHSCQKFVREYAGQEYPIEDFAGCPENSPYRSVMEAYFDRHGMKSAPDNWYKHTE